MIYWIYVCIPMDNMENLQMLVGLFLKIKFLIDGCQWWLIIITNHVHHKFTSFMCLF
jgi:hypothetical protein